MSETTNTTEGAAEAIRVAMEAGETVIAIHPWILGGIYLFVNLAYTYVLVWGLRNVAFALGESGDDQGGNGNNGATPQRSGWNRMLRTHSRPTVEGDQVDDKGNPITSPEPDISYARVSGAIGSIAIASLFVAISYWLIFALFFGNGKGAYDVGSRINSMSGFFIAGAALFLPYAFERLTSFFRG